MKETETFKGSSINPVHPPVKDDLAAKQRPGVIARDTLLLHRGQGRKQTERKEVG